MLKTCGVVCALVLLAGCGAPKIRQAPLPAQTSQDREPPPPAAVVYRIDPTQSELRILVHRAGPMARFGHNHVIVNRAIDGRVIAADGESGSSFVLRVPVAEFVVDDAVARREAGADFADEVPDDAKSGTRRNMLGSAVLNAASYPDIILSSTTVAVSAGAQDTSGTSAERRVATLTLRVAGHETRRDVPFMLEVASGRLAASGTALLRQSDIGIAPFSVMLGALQVQDEFTVEFKFVALAAT